MQSRVVHVSYSSGGGAGKIASLLAATQKELGVASELLAVSNKSISEEPLNNPQLAAKTLLERYLLSRPHSSLMTPLRGNDGSILDRILTDVEVVNLHWLPGAVAERELRKLLDSGLKVVWTLHDLRPLTGACHYTQECNRFESGCQVCPQAKTLAHSLITKNLDSKTGIFESRNFAFVGPSSGLVDAARRSVVGRSARVEFIPNPVAPSEAPAEALVPTDTKSLRLLFVAADAAEPRKGLKNVVSWFKGLDRKGSELRVVGRNSDAFAEPGLVTSLGSLSTTELQAEYQLANALVFGSTEDNAPGVLAEAAAHSLPIICLEDQMTKWLESDGLKVFGTHDLDQAIYVDRSQLRLAYQPFLEARDRFTVAKRYLELYASL